MGKLKVGYWAGQEQYDPNTLINYSKLAEVVGFDIVITSDHFHPWRDSNSFNFSGFLPMVGGVNSTMV